MKKGGSFSPQKMLLSGFDIGVQFTLTQFSEQSLKTFREKWDKDYPTIADSWERNWQEIIPFLAFPASIRKAIYTTNAIEVANR